MLRALLIAILLIPAALLAQLPPRVLKPGETPLETVNPEEASSISGRVVNAATGKGLSNASIRLTRDVLVSNSLVPAFTTATDGDGKFAMKMLPPGAYQLSVQRSGFLPSSYGARRPGSAGSLLTLVAKQSLTDLTIQMRPGGAVSGRVTDEFGEPMEQVRIEALRYSYVNGERTLASVGMYSTNDLGEYRIFGLDAGRYYFRVTPAATSSAGVDRTAGDRPRESYMPVYYPGVAEASLAAAVDLAAGAQQAGINFQLRKERGFRVQAKVVNQPGDGGRMSVIVRPRTGQLTSSSYRTATINASGQIDLDGFRPGNYMLVVMARSADQLLTGRLDFDIADRDVKDLGVALAPGMDLMGQLIVEDETPIDFTSMQVTLRSVDSMGLISNGAQVNKDGTFVVKAVPPGVARFKMLQLPENCYSITVRLGDQEVNDLVVDLTRGVPGPLTVRLRGKSPRVEGTAVGKDGKPMAGATVVMVPDMPSQRGVSNFYMNEHTNQKGQFALRWLWPGDYKLYAWEDVEEGAWLDDEFLKPFGSKAKPISLKEGDQRQIQVEVIPADQ